MAKETFFETYLDREEFDKEMERFYAQFTGEGLATMIRPVADDIGKTFQNVIEKEKLIWKRNLYKSIEVDLVKVSENEVTYSIMPKAPYALTLEKGLPHTANIEKLREWVKDKLTTDVDQVEALTYFLYKKFRDVGAKPHPYFEQVTDIVFRKAVSMIEKTIYEHLNKFEFASGKLPPIPPLPPFP